MSSFGQKLSECRKAKKMSQKELAKIFKTSHTTIGKYERDEMIPSIEVSKNIRYDCRLSIRRDRASRFIQGS